MMDSGLVSIYQLTNSAQSGLMPKEVLSPLTEDGETLEWQFESRNISYSRQYAAEGVGQRVDMLIRIEYAPQVKIGMYAILTDYDGQENADGDQYRIDLVSTHTDDFGLKVTDLTLYRLDELYELATET